MAPVHVLKFTKVRTYKKKQQIEQIYCAHFIKLMNFDVRYEHFEQQQHQAQTAAQKMAKRYVY